METHWHSLTPEQALTAAESTTAGLALEEHARRLSDHGPNELEAGSQTSILELVIGQFKDFMILVLLAAAVLAGVTGELVDALAILVILLINATIGFFQEFRAQKAIAALRAMAAPHAVVVRGGNRVSVPAAELVRGDVVMLEAGNIVPADLRLLETGRLKVDESALTGESIPAEKLVAELAEVTRVADRHNMAFKGTIVTYGRAAGLVVETGMATQFGRIAKMIQSAEETLTPLQKSLAVFGKRLAIIVLLLCAVFFAAGVAQGRETLEMLLTAISMAVAAIPEALPALVTIALALGARNLVRQNALIRKLPAVESLGAVTFVCTDKTGTLTLNRMVVEHVVVDGQRVSAERAAEVVAPDAFLALALALSNDAGIDSEGHSFGDPTEVALLEFAQRVGAEKSALETRYPRVAELPFDSERKRMTTVHACGDGTFVSFTKGAAESFENATAIETSNALAAEGLRTLAFAMRRWPTMPEVGPQIEDDLEFLGVVAMMDPPREEAAEAVATCRSAGIHPVMITGDHLGTATAIAKRLGILTAPSDRCLTGIELDRLADAEFTDLVEHVRVYARVAPEQKLRIVEALQARGHYVAMTGDGVNDAPALRRADIGVAMGHGGTDVAKEAADMVLLDDNFATIVAAVREGRRVFDNILKFLKYVVTSNSGELWTMFLAPLFGLPIPLVPIQILWINVVTDGLPGLALAAEPPEPGIMTRAPRNPQDSVFANGMGVHIVWVGLLMGLVSVALQAYLVSTDVAVWQTMVFSVLCMSQLGHAIAIHAGNVSIFQKGFFENRVFFGAIALAFLAQTSAIYVPFLQPILKTQALSAQQFGLCVLVSAVVVVAVELEKTWKRRSRSHR